MKVVNVNDILPGRALAKDVLSREGRVIYSAGEILSRAHLVVLREWGIDSVTLASAPGASRGQAAPEASFCAQVPRPEARAQQAQPPEPPEDIIQALQESMAERFRLHNLDSPHIKILFDLSVERQSRILLGKPGRVSLKGSHAPAFRIERPPKVSLRALLETGHRVGTLPNVFQRLVELIDKPEVSTDALAAVIATDQALTARLLRLVNSPFFGLAYRIDNIARAVVIVGTRQLVMLAMGAILVSSFKGLPVTLVNMRSFWSHSLSCGAAARLLARHMGLPLPERFFVAGLLHDLARLIIYAQLPKHALYILTEARRRNEQVRVLEKETLGFTHDALGAELLGRWNCPKELVMRVGRHHMALVASSDAEDLILPVADMISQAAGYGSSGESIVPALPGLVWDRLGLRPEGLLEHLAQLDDTVRSLRSFFEL